MKKLFALCLALCLLVLCGCGGNTSETEATTEPTSVTTSPTSESTTAPTTEATETPTEETEPALLYRNPLTGELLEAPHETRIVSISIGNTKAAMPTYGLTQADMIFELYVNDLATRLLALYTDPTDVSAIGSVRSQRYHLTDIAVSYDTIAISAGGSDKVLSDVRKSGADYLNLNATVGANYTFRDEARHSSGYAWEHCLFLYGADLYNYAESQGYSTAMDQEKDYGMTWAEDKALTDGTPASTVTLTFKLSSSAKDSIFTYNAETGLYAFRQYNMDMVDGPTQEPLAFRNVFIILADTWTDADGYHVSNLLGSGSGYFACDGYMIPILWHRETDADTFTFTLEDGTPLAQGVGTSYIAIAPVKSTVTAE